MPQKMPQLIAAIHTQSAEMRSIRFLLKAFVCENQSYTDM